MKVKTVAVIVTFLGLFRFLFGQVLPDESQLSAYRQLNTKFQKNIGVHWNETNGSVDIITFSSPVIFNEDQGKSAEIFLKEINDLFKYRINEDSLVLIKYKEKKGRKYFRYQQTYNNIPVKGGEYVINVLPDGSVRTALGSFYKDISTSTVPEISYKEALLIALKNPPYIKELKESLFSYKLIIYPKEDNLSFPPKTGEVA